MTTKEQERKALEQIKKIVASLGENSYVGTAFEGCFEIAAENIENDFACSMKDRAETAEKKVATLELDNRDLRIAINEAKEAASKKQTELEEKNRKLESAVIGIDWLCDLQDLVDAEIIVAENKATEAAETIVTWADNPASTAFKNAVSLHRSMKERKAYYENVRDQIIRAKAASMHAAKE